jgi:hypothetical protein
MQFEERTIGNILEDKAKTIGGKVYFLHGDMKITYQEMNARANSVANSLLGLGIKKGDIWLNKIRYDAEGKRIYGNVCLEVYLPSRGTCLLQHVNLGACNIQDLVPAFTEGMSSLVALHAKTGVGETGEYLSPETDRQVGLGILGLANFLCQNGVTYKEFGIALNQFHSHKPEHTPAYLLVSELAKAIEIAAQIARVNKMDRAFAIAPTASCSYNNVDLRGYTTAPELAPPISRHVSTT